MGYVSFQEVEITRNEGNLGSHGTYYSPEILNLKMADYNRVVSFSLDPFSGFILVFGQPKIIQNFYTLQD